MLKEFVLEDSYKLLWREGFVKIKNRPKNTIKIPIAEEFDEV